MKKLLSLFMLAALGSMSLVADQIKMVDGSTINGKVIEIFSGKVKVNTGFAGELTIDRANVAEIVTDAPVMVALPQGKMSAKLNVKDGKQAVGDVAIVPEDLSAMWQLDGIDPTLPKPPEPAKWSYEAAVNIAGKTGNTEKFGGGGSLKATMKAPEDQLQLYLKGNYAKENGTKNEEEIIGGLDYERRIANSQNSWYIRSEVEHDEINNYDVFLTAAAGYGYYLMDEDDLKIRLRFGISYQRKDYVDNTMDTDDAVGLDANYHHEMKIHKLFGIKDFGKLVTDVTYNPSFEEWSEDYRIVHESSLDMPLGGSKFWVLRLGVTNEYNNRVAPHTNRLDTSYFARLVLSWE